MTAAAELVAQLIQKDNELNRFTRVLREVHQIVSSGQYDDDLPSLKTIVTSIIRGVLHEYPHNTDRSGT